MKKKIVAMCATVALATVAIAGGSLAYFTDEDGATNTFTTGNVDIVLDETFVQDSKLIPGIDVEKVVNVDNTGSEPAYVRVHVAVPSMLDSGSEDQPQFAAYNNTLHWNFAKAAVAEGEWNWHKTNVNGTAAGMPGYPENGGDWNMYQQTIGGVLYNVYVGTYETALAAETGTTATDAIYKVFLDTKVTDEQLAAIDEELGQIKILVVAEGGQTAGFNNAYDALNTQFGVPGTYNPWA